MKKWTIAPALLVTGTLTYANAQEEQRPNFIVILVDDMGYSDLGCYGSEIKTPHIDHLRKQGMLFSQFYANSRSCPTRASLLTGLYPSRAGMGEMTENIGVPEYQGFLNKECLTLGEAMKANGYATYLSGKWHVGDADGQWPYDRGFERSFTFLGGATDYYEPENMAIDHQQIQIKDSSFYLTTAISDYAVRFIREQEKSEKPMMMYVAYNTPHWPLQAPYERIRKHLAYYQRGWDQIREERFKRMRQKRVISAQTKLTPLHPNVPAWNNYPKEEQQKWCIKMATYASMIEMVDDGIGQIIKELKRQKKLDNTFILFLSDNGACPHPMNKPVKYPNNKMWERGTSTYYDFPGANVSSTPFSFFKRWSHEGGICVPCIAFYPKMIKAGSQCNVPAHVIDVLPTLLDLGKGHYPSTYEGRKIQPLDGVTMRPLLLDPTTTIHDVIGWEHSGNRGIRKGDWKLVYNFDKGAKRWELYNIAQDRTELNNLSTKYPEKVQELAQEYEKWSRQNRVIEFSLRQKMLKEYTAKLKEKERLK